MSNKLQNQIPKPTEAQEQEALFDGQILPWVNIPKSNFYIISRTRVNAAFITVPPCAVKA